MVDSLQYIPQIPNLQGGRAGVPSQPVGLSPLWCSVGDAGAWWGGLAGTLFTAALSRSLMSAAELPVELQSFSCLAWHIFCWGSADG